ncbi:MAG: hypothetical protein OWS74_05075 [Firmicutes bacterium]|nr:hypothetical protein [Bacillota bacterium]
MSTEEEVVDQGKEEQGKIDFKKIIHLNFIGGAFNCTFLPFYVLYNTEAGNYFIAKSKRGRIIIYKDFAFLKTGNGNIAIDTLPAGNRLPGGPVVEFVKLYNIKIDTASSASGVVQINYTRNGEYKSLIVGTTVDDILWSNFGYESVIIYDALIHYTH